jgi:hypothetical protein
MKIKIKKVVLTLRLVVLIFGKKSVIKIIAKKIFMPLLMQILRGVLQYQLKNKI